MLVRYTAEELAAVRVAAQASSLPVARYVREMSLGSLKARGAAASDELIHELGRIANRLTQLTRAASATGSLLESQHIQAVLAQVVSTLRRIA